VAKALMVCPFSRQQCRECALFRGRHFNLCLSPRYSHLFSDWSQTAGVGPRANKRNSPIKKPPELPESPRWLANVEELVERSEL